METLRNQILEVIKAHPKSTFVDIVCQFTDYTRATIHEQLALMSASGILKKTVDKGVACYEAA